MNAAEHSAFEEVDRRYRQRLCGLVQKELGKRFGRREDPEDAVQSALRSFYRGVEAHRFRIDHSGALWRLLSQIARRKVLQRAERHQAQKRRPGREVDHRLETLASKDPTPDEAAHAADMCQQVLLGLDELGAQVFRMRLQGWTRAEIAAELRCTDGVVRGRLTKVQSLLSPLLDR